MTGFFDYEDNHIIHADQFNQAAWTDISKDSNAVKALVEKGKIDVGEKFDGLVDDVFQSLYQYAPTPREDAPEGLAGNKLLVDQLHASQEFENLRNEAFLDQDMSAIGTLMLADNLREQVANDKELKDTLDELNGEGGNKNGEGEEGDQPGDKPSNKQGKKPTEEQTKVVRRAIEKATKKAGDQLIEAGQALDSFGLGEAELTKVPLDERKALIDRLLNNPKLKEIAELVGRLDRILTTTKMSRVKHGQEEIVDITLSNDLARLTPRELVMMDEAPEDFARRFANRELITYSLEGQEPVGKGPMVILIDKSASMRGDRDNWATAITFSLMMQAHRDKRDIYYCAFNTRVMRSERYEAGQYNFEDLMKLTEIGPSGGTSFEVAIEHALEACKADIKLREADVVFVTDGTDSIQQRWIDSVNEQKKKQKINIFTILINEYANADDHDLNKISTKVYGIEDVIKTEDTSDAVAQLIHSTNV